MKNQISNEKKIIQDKNKSAARESRNRKKVYVKLLEHKVEALTKEV